MSTSRHMGKCIHPLQLKVQSLNQGGVITDNNKIKTHPEKLEVLVDSPNSRSSEVKEITT